MNIRIGDEVKYLNDVGGGKVIEIRNKKIAVVLQDDGFEVPVLINECIKVERASISSAPIIQTENKPTENYEYTEINSPEGESVNLLLAFISANPKSNDYSDLDLYLVNDSNYFVSYCFGSFNNKLAKLESRDIIEPNTKVLLNTYEKRQLPELKEFWFNGMLYKIDKVFDKRSPVEFSVQLKPEKFENTAFKENDYFDSRARIFFMVENDIYKALINLSEKDIEKSKRERVQPKREKVEVPKNQIFEVDLHINELLDNLTGLSNADILNYQMSKFREVLEANKNDKGRKIVFIHGLGNGTLKTELRKELDRKKMRHQDASFKEYGFGATMVII